MCEGRVWGQRGVAGEESGGGPALGRLAEKRHLCQQANHVTFLMNVLGRRETKAGQRDADLLEVKGKEDLFPPMWAEGRRSALPCHLQIAGFSETNETTPTSECVRGACGQKRKS